jgi:hypothetical protein
VRVDRISLLLLNLLALTRVFAAPPVLVGLAAILFLIRITAMMRDMTGIGASTQAVLSPSSVPASRT